MSGRPPNPPAPVRRMLESGLPLPMERALVHELARYLHALLQLRSPAGSDAFARTLHGIAEASARRIPRAPELACRAGCSLCCRTHVSLLAPEAFVLARQARQNPALAARIRALAAIVPVTDIATRRREGIACSFLEDDRCSAYAQRPLNCRLLASFNLRACEVAALGGPDLVPQPGEFANFRSLLTLAAGAALHAAGLPVTGYEFNQTLLQLLDDEDAEARYFAGGGDFGVVMPGRDDWQPAMLKEVAAVVAAARL